MIIVSAGGSLQKSYYRGIELNEFLTFSETSLEEKGNKRLEWPKR